MVTILCPIDRLIELLFYILSHSTQFEILLANQTFLLLFFFLIFCCKTHIIWGYGSSNVLIGINPFSCRIMTGFYNRSTHEWTQSHQHTGIIVDFYQLLIRVELHSNSGTNRNSELELEFQFASLSELKWNWAQPCSSCSNKVAVFCYSLRERCPRLQYPNVLKLKQYCLQHDG